MKVLILGGVAAGTKVAAKLLRENRDCEVTVLTKGKDISYAGCGLPYYVGGVIQDRSQLIVNTPEKFAGLTGARVITQTEALAVHPAEHKVTARDLSSGQEQDYGYDKLVIATGASPFLPPVPGLELKNVFVMRTPDDAIALREALEAGEIAAAGLDVLEKEPLEPSNPLGRIQDSTRLIITPHLAWASVEARRRCVQEAYENIAAFLRGEARNVVNP